MFAYCLNNPIIYTDRKGTSAKSDALQWWANTMWWLPLADTVSIICDFVYYGGLVLCGVVTLCTLAQTVPEVSLEEENEKVEPEPPSVTYPGDDPTKAPDGTVWKGKGEQGSKQGNYHNSETGESWHPDLDHPDPIGPHWDYRDPSGTWWRVGPGDLITLK